MASSIPIVAQERHDFDMNNEVCNHYYMIGGDETNCYLKLVINSEDMHLQLLDIYQDFHIKLRMQ